MTGVLFFFLYQQLWTKNGKDRGNWLRALACSSFPTISDSCKRGRVRLGGIRLPRCLSFLCLSISWLPARQEVESGRGDF